MEGPRWAEGWRNRDPPSLILCEPEKGHTRCNSYKRYDWQDCDNTRAITNSAIRGSGFGMIRAFTAWAHVRRGCRHGRRGGTFQRHCHCRRHKALPDQAQRKGQDQSNCPQGVNRIMHHHRFNKVQSRSVQEANRRGPPGVTTSACQDFTRRSWHRRRSSVELGQESHPPRPRRSAATGRWRNSQTRGPPSDRRPSIPISLRP